MEIFQLIYVNEVANCSSLSKAAEKLYITQSALSQQLKRLESEIGFMIFERTSRGVTLTFAGRTFLNEAIPVIRAYKKLEKSVHNLSASLNDTLVFGSSPISAPHISEGLSAFFLLYPNVKFSYVENWDMNLLEMARSKEADIVLLCLPHDNEKKDDLFIWPIREEYICAVINKNHKLAGRESIALKDLENERLAFSSPSSGLRHVMIDAMEKNNVHPEKIIELITLEARLSLVRNGAIAPVMSEQFKIYKTSDFSVIPIEPKIYRTFALVTNVENKDNILIRAFADIAIQNINMRLAANAP